MLYNYIKDHYKKAELIFFSDLLRENITEQDLKLQMNELCEKGFLQQYDAEVYFIPKKTMLNSMVGPNADMVSQFHIRCIETEVWISYRKKTL